MPTYWTLIYLNIQGRIPVLMPFHLPILLNKEQKMNSLIIEIRAAEGGSDSKLLVEDQFVIYQKMAIKERL